MKKNIIKLLFIVPFFTIGCVDLNYNEISNSDEDWVYSSPIYGIQKLVNNIYAQLDYDFGSFGGGMYSSATDESDFANSLSSIHYFYNGVWSPINPFDYFYTNSYSAIAQANAFLEKLDKISLENYLYNSDGSGEMSYERLKAQFEMYPYEVRFLRAYFYFELVRAYGDIPLVTKTLTNQEANMVKRTPANDVFKFIVDECDAIAEFLPITFATELSQQTGRASRPMVMALKARALLYAASPLFNKTNDKELWKKAASANKYVLDNALSWGIQMETYSGLWGDGGFKSKEIIFGRPVGYKNDFEKNNYPVGVENGNSGNCPTQSLVDAYEYSDNGESFGERWNESTINVTLDEPFLGLDPRFEMTIVKNGDTWPSYNPSPIETFEGGLNAPPLTNATTTGYYLKKYCDGTVNISTNSSNTKRHTWIIFRLAEFYLNYAEAVYNYSGNADSKDEFGMSANEAVNKVRARQDVDMPPFKGNDGFYERYQRERMVELAFEGHRFWDVRRWMQGEQFFSGVKIASYTKNAYGELILKRSSIYRGWKNKYYLFPIPFSESQINKNLGQNPDWNL